MNRQHLRAFFWLRWRLFVNQLRKGGIANALLLAILAAAGLGLAVLLFVAALLVGLFALPKVSPLVLLFVWDGVIVAFLFCWMIGLLTELQRSEPLSLDKFLHLPVSLGGAFLINYLSSLLSLTLIVFVPVLIGLIIGLTFGRGPAMLLLLPAVAALLLMVTAVTYQFQSWLASLMVNKRRRRTVIVVVTMVFVLAAQLPNLINVIQPWKQPQQDELDVRYAEDQAALQRALAAHEITPDEYQERSEALQREHRERKQELSQATWQQVERTAWLINLAVPFGWLPLGAKGLAEGKVLPALLGALGLATIGSASLWRAYRTTLRLYTGTYTAGKGKPAPAPPPAKVGQPTAGLLEKELPWVSEHAAAVALASLRSLLRAPEAKMLLLTPVILTVVFGAMLLTRSNGIFSPVFLPFLAFGAMAMILLTMVQLVGNQFGFDRNGFRVFVLCPAPRRDILLGKNLAVAPLALGLMTMVFVPLQVVYPMRVSHILAALPQQLSMYLMFCVMANWLSILAPMRVAAGSLKPTNMKLVPFLLQMAFLLLLPLALVPTLLPLVAEFVLEDLGLVTGVPVCLVLSVAECVGVVYLYRFVLIWQGRLLQAREQTILEMVTTKAE